VYIPGEEKNYSRNRSRRSADVVSAILFAAIIILAFLRNSQIIVVIALYACILLEGISISVFMMYSRSRSETGYSFDDTTKTYSAGGKGNDIVDSMNVYVKYASQGSDHSRREIVRILRNVMEFEASKKHGNLSSDKTFRSDLERIGIPFADTKKVPEKGQFLGKSKTKVSRRDREAYLTSLERIVQKLVDN
jgi:hypothetical protein